MSDDRHPCVCTFSCRDHWDEDHYCRQLPDPATPARLAKAPPVADGRLTESLAERLYAAHNEWRYDLSEFASTWPRWFALREDLKVVYREAAASLISGEVAA